VARARGPAPPGWRREYDQCSREAFRGCTGPRRPDGAGTVRRTPGRRPSPRARAPAATTRSTGRPVAWLVRRERQDRFGTYAIEPSRVVRRAGRHGRSLCPRLLLERVGERDREVGQEGRVEPVGVLETG
jgi:hypothetical protein